MDEIVYDVVICGGGLAGLSLARQLKLDQPERSVLVLERYGQPLPETTHKVGESMTEAGAHYLSHTLALPGYFAQKHVNKLGFRFFFGQATEPFHKRPEFGISQFPTVPSYNIDRGMLENDLRQFALEVEVVLLDDCRVHRIELAHMQELHKICIQQGTHGPRQWIQARWVVDAMGRRRYLQKKLGLQKDIPKLCNAVWFRVPGQVDIDDFVPQHEQAWHGRVPGRIRYASTNHLMGKGYWTWLIPLPTGNTSVGIVAAEALHPFAEYNTHERALQWLCTHEPLLAAQLETLIPLDFKCMKQYTFSSQQIFSEQRWACIGDAGLFADPLYAPGVDFIGLANHMTAEMICRDFAHQLVPEFVKSCNQMIIALNDAITHNIQLGYPLFDQPSVTAAKVLWDTAAGWAFFAPHIFNTIFKDAETALRVRKAKAGYYFLTQQMQQLFAEWASKTTGRCTFDFIDFLQISVLQELRARNFVPNKSADELVADHLQNMEQIEALALSLFLVAVEDVLPEHLADLTSHEWLNAWRVTLEPDQWSDDGLYTPRTPKRDIKTIYQEIRNLFHFVQPDRAIRQKQAHKVGNLKGRLHEGQ